MNLRMYFAGGRGFWMAVGGGAVLVLILLFAWARPAYDSAVQARQALDQVCIELNYYESVAEEIPSPRALDDRQDFRGWLEGQARIVDEFFTERGALINATLTGMENPEPTRFKDAYSQALARQADWFEQNRRRMEVANPTTAFTVYGWVRSNELPTRDIYPKVRRGYWSRHYLYRRFHEARASAVARLAVGEDFVPLTDKYGGMRFSAELDIAPDRVAGLLEKMLKVSPSDDPGAIFLIESFGVSGKPETAGPRPLCRVSMSGHVLVLR